MTVIRPFDAVLLGPLWIVTVYFARRALTGDRRAWPLSGMIALITLSVTLGVPGIRRALETATGAVGVTTLLTHLLSLAALTCLIAFTRRLTQGTAAGTAAKPRGGLLRALPLPVAAVALSVAFFLSPHPDAEAHLLTQTPTASVYAYWSVYLLYVCWGMAESGRLCHRYRNEAPRGPLRTSLHLLGVATVSGLVYVAHRAVFLVLGVRDFWPLREDVVVATTQALLALTLLLTVTGIAWPGLADLDRAWRIRRLLRRIRPLWEAIGEAVPEVVLRLPDELSSMPDVLLYRRVIEISDGMLVLAPDCGEAARAEARRRLSAAGLTGDRLEAAVDAACLRRAVARRRAGPDAPPVPAVPAPGGGGHHPGDPQDLEGPNEGEAQCARFELVARYYTSPLVIGVAGALRHDPLRAA
ncbi:MAB_1171c family putative transporter [Streptomyces sp. NPDC055815]